MGRIFTVDFSYCEKVYPALVKIFAAQRHFSITFHVPDTSLHHLLPGGKVSYNSTDGFTTPQEASTSTLDLIDCMANAVEKHLSMSYDPQAY